MPSSAANPQAMTRVVQATRPLLRVSRPLEGRYIWLRKGKEGSLQTAVEMAKLVRRDAVSDEGLERFTVQKIIDARLDSHSRPEDVIEVIFNYVQSIPYIYDPAGSFDSVQNARHTLSKGYGDCDDLAVLLATMLALAGYKPRFVLARYKEATAGFDHVYVDVELASGGRIALDPCSRSHAAGWESRNAIERLTFPIFAGRVSSSLGLSPIVQTGIATGLNFVPVIGPLLGTAAGLIFKFTDRTQQRAEETARDQWKAQVHDSMLATQRRIDACEISPQQGVAEAKQLVTAYYQACDQNFTKSSVAKSCRNAETEAGGFAEREARMANSKSCAASGASALGGSSAAGTLSSGIAGISWPLILIVAGGVYFLMRGR